jgi:hypothetical protein
MYLSAKIVKEGLVIGLIGYATVALLYAVFDLVSGHGFLFTVNLLGKALFSGFLNLSELTAPLQLDMTVIFWYNAFHLLTALVIGLLVISFIELTDRQPSQGQFVLFILFLGFVFTVVAVGFLTSPISMFIPWWSIVIANLASVIAASYYLFKKHPGIGPHLLYLLAKITALPFKNKPPT